MRQGLQKWRTAPGTGEPACLNVLKSFPAVFNTVQLASELHMLIRYLAATAAKGA